ncbi:MAG: SusC/RagA family TonB-linked outer membrane protein, partial [Bacteroidota bacterium]
FKFTGLLALVVALFAPFAMMAQELNVSGTVTSSEDGLPMPGVSIIIVGTSTGTSTDFDGNYSLDANNGDQLQFNFIGYTDKTVTVTGATLNVVLEPDAKALDEVVVTALGVSREKKSLGYATQTVGGDDINTVKSSNFVNNLSGKAAGVQIKTNNNFGGSTNVVIRGTTSLAGSNQALFVVDGIPVDNTVANSDNQQSGRRGYDYGNNAADINPEDIESMNILKGAAATALYGSRAANGVVLITTKSGKKNKGIGVTVSSSVTTGTIDKSTFAEYQNEYGAGYGPYYGSTGYFNDGAFGDPNALVTPTTEDASFGARFADGWDVYQWDSFIPESPNYGKAYPYQAATHTPIDFFENELSLTNSVALSGGNENGTFRLSYTNTYQDGILPNSKLNKHNLTFKATNKFSDRFEAGANASYIQQDVTGRNSTGYGDNLMAEFRQWWQVNVDVQDLKDLYEQTGRNATWNSVSPENGIMQPIYWDNPYWTRYKNYQTDTRDRFIGSLFAKYSVIDGINITARASVDTYNTLQEERRAQGSVATEFGLLNANEVSGYARTNIAFTELNYDLFADYNFDLTDNLSLSGIVGTNIRTNSYSTLRASTSGGLVVDGIYSLNNSLNNVPTPIEYLGQKQVNGIYANASLGFMNMFYLEGSFRRDASSALPEDARAYNYGSVSGSFLFSELLDLDWVELGKLRANYAVVGNDLDPLNILDTYYRPNNFGSSPIYSVGSTKNNPELLPEKTKSYEIGLEMNMFQNRLGFDFAWYKSNTYNQLIRSEVSRATGYSAKWVNAGNIQNNGYELAVFGAPVVTSDFRWDVTVNWSKNISEVIELYVNPATGEPLDALTLGNFQGGISSNAIVGEPFGVLKGTGYTYHENGGKLVNSDGYYVSNPDEVIADPNPDFMMGITNSFSWRGLKLSFLIDIQQGGDVYSLDMHYGQGTGVLAHTAGLNELGNPIRDAVADGGGILNEGVKEDGTPNDVRARADYYGGAFYWGNSARNPAALTVYDASYVKLRELSLSYSLPKSMLGDGFFKNVSFGATGNNLWIIHKNVPYADPESGLGAGNMQGYLSGSYPTVKRYGFNVKLDF